MRNSVNTNLCYAECTYVKEVATVVSTDPYDEGFDPVRHMLENLPEDSSAMDELYFDAKVGGKLLQLDMITERLSKQVMENHEEMVKGMLLVTDLDRDLQLTSIICRNGRRFLSRATQEVTQDLLVAANVRKKQILLDILPVLERVQQAVEIKSQLDLTTQKGNYALALQMCLECVLHLQHCSELRAVMEVNHNLEEWLHRTIDKVDNVLLAVCHKFNAEKFESVLLTYVVLDDVSGLAEKAQTFYGQIVVSETHAVVRSILFEAQDSQVLLQKSRVQYNDLCSQLSEAQFKECLRRSLEVLFDLLSSYHQMMTCKQLMEFVATPNQSIHKGGFRHLRHTKFDFENQNEDSSGETAGVEESQDKPSEVRGAMLSVARALERGRKTVWELSARRVAVLLSADAFSTTSPHQFLQSLDWLNKFILAGEAFCGAEAMTLRAKVVKQSEKYYWTFHRQNLEVLLIILEREPWLSTPSMRRLCLAGLVNGTSQSGLGSDGASYQLKGIDTALITTNKSSLRTSFDDWIGKGNPFTDRRILLVLPVRVPESGTRTGMDEDLGRPLRYRKGGDDEGEDEDLLADFIDEDSQLPGRRLTDYQETSPKTAHGDEVLLTLTSSAVSILRYMDKYVKLMQILQPIVSEVFRGLCQLFELYFFTVYKAFGNRDFLTASLRSTLLRISQGLEEQRIQSPGLTSQSGSPTSSQSSSEPSPNSGGPVLLMSPGNLYALEERTVAVQTLLCLSQILERSCAHFRTILPQDAKAYMEQFFVQTVALVPDLTAHVYKVVARSMLNIGGYVERIANARWELKELDLEHNGYVDLLLGEFKQYTKKLSQGNILKEVHEAMLDYGVDVLAETILEGISRVKRCNNEGRAMMSLDLQVLINGLHHLASSRSKSSLIIVETYIKAFYLPETEYPHWIRAHPEYSKTQVIGLINLVASTYNWKRKTRTDLLEKIEAGEL